MKIKLQDEVRNAATIILPYISERQRKFPDDSWEYKQLGEYYDKIWDLTGAELEL